MSETIDRINREVNAAFSTAEGGHSKITVTAHDLRAMLNALKEQERSIITLENRLAAVETAVTDFEDALAFTPVENLPEEDDLYECFCGSDVESGGHLFLNFEASSGLFFEQQDDEDVVREDVLFWRPVLPPPGETVDILPSEE